MQPKSDHAAHLRQRDIRATLLHAWPLRRGRRRLGRLLGLTTVTIPEGAVVITKPLGASIKVHPDDVYFDVYFFGDYERRETEAMLGIIRKDTLVVDVGANFGWFTINALLSEPTRQVVAYEPQVELCEELLRNLELNQLKNSVDHNLHLRPCAVGASESEIELQKINGGSHALTTSYVQKAVSGNTFKARLASLDSEFSSLGHDCPLFIKCDVEGGEMEVLRGAVQLCARKIKPVWLLEINHERAGLAGWSLPEMGGFLKNSGYSHLFFMSHAQHPTLLSDADLSTETRNGNILALAESCHHLEIRTVTGER
jgi:FkbM family methyltransferase